MSVGKKERGRFIQGLAAAVVIAAVVLGITVSLASYASNREESGLKTNLALSGQADDRAPEEEWREFKLNGTSLSLKHPADWTVIKGNPVRIDGGDATVEVYGEQNPAGLSAGKWLDQKVFLPQNPISVLRREPRWVDSETGVLIEADSESGHFRSLYLRLGEQMIVVTVFFDPREKNQIEAAERIIQSVSVKE